MNYRWLLAPPQPLLAVKLAADLQISPVLAQCLVNRGHCDPDAIAPFLQPRLKQLADPFALPNMRAAVERLFQARANRELVVIFGDYDVDGVASTVILKEFLCTLGWEVGHYLPHRMDEGYGLSREGVENCLKKFPARVLLAVDCGSTAVDPIAWLNGKGVNVLVVDHHQVSAPAPAALALINPQLESASAAGAAAPNSRDLCSVGLAFKLAHALVKHGRALALPGFAEADLRPLLDLVALGVIADLVPLTGENRIFVAMGLERLQTTSRAGLVALKKVAGTAPSFGASEVAFQLAPRLNAAGRLEDAEEALQLLMAPDLPAAAPIAATLDLRNRERQKIERAIAQEVIGALQARFNPQNDFVIVEGGMLWHIGVVGIVASRVLQRFYRPTIILGGDGGGWRGSGRSIAGFDLAAALRECDDLLIRHGGHALAAGLSVELPKLDQFRARLNDLARKILRPDDLQPPLRLDAEMGLAELTQERLDELDKLKPLGQGNPPAHFIARNLTQARPLQRMGADKQHVKLWVTDGKAMHEAIWWGAGQQASLPVGRFDLAFCPQINDYNGRQTIQLKVLDWRPAIS